MASSSHLKPGEEGKIVATVDTIGRLGYISKTVKVYTNDPKKLSITLFLRALIKKPSSSP